MSDDENVLPFRKGVSEASSVADDGHARPEATPDNLVSMAELREDNTLTTPELLLLETLQQVRKGELTGKQMAIVILDRGPEDRQYQVSYRFAGGLKSSELLALFEVAKCQALRWMGFIQ